MARELLITFTRFLLLAGLVFCGCNNAAQAQTFPDQRTNLPNSWRMFHSRATDSGSFSQREGSLTGELQNGIAATDLNANEVSLQMLNAGMLSLPTGHVLNDRNSSEATCQQQAEQMFMGHSFELDLEPADNDLSRQLEAEVVLGRSSGFGAIVSKGIAKAVYRSAAKNTLGDDVIEREALRSGTLRRDLYQR